MAGRKVWGLKQLHLQMLCKRRNFEAICRRWASTSSQVHENCNASLLKKLNAKIPEESDNVCIYRVPVKLRQVEAKAYHPSIVSIGPYHRGDRHLKETEELKLKFFRSVFRSKEKHEADVGRVISAMEELEPKARSCYADDVKLSSDEFVEMMIIDGCFVLQLLREVGGCCSSSSSLIPRWMLPTLRRDLIKLENQLPMIVLHELLDLIDNNSPGEYSMLSLQDLTLKFFYPLLRRDSLINAAGATAMMNTACHFLDLFRSSILPEIREQDRKKQVHLIQSTTELKEAGVILESSQNDRALDVRSEGRVLKIPPLHIDDHRGTLFRNMVAFEQCHKKCKPDATAYLFFFDGLVNSAGDVEILHYKGIVHHSLGNNKEAANLVNKLCKEVDWDGEESYLHKVVCDDIDVYFKSRYAKLRARLVHYYFNNWVVGISTVLGLFALYLTLIQTGCSVASTVEALMENGFWSYLSASFSLPFSRPSTPLDQKDSKGECKQICKLFWMY